MEEDSDYLIGYNGMTTAMLVPRFEMVMKPAITITQQKSRLMTPDGCLFVWNEDEYEEYRKKVNSLSAKQVSPVQPVGEGSTQSLQV